jgi:hypothetical protein
MICAKSHLGLQISQDTIANNWRTGQDKSANTYVIEIAL